VVAARVPTQSGLVGLRPRGEPLVLVVESGLVLLRLAAATRYAATAGGLLQADRARCTLWTPFASVGDSAEEMLQSLDRMLATPPSELVAHRQLGELEQRIIAELRERPRGAPLTRPERVGPEGR